MNSYLIKLYNNTISVFEILPDTIVPLKFKGEKVQVFCKETFWIKFKEKIKYDNEDLCFVINTDSDDFKIDDSIKISKKQFLDSLTIQYLISSYIEGELKTFFIPKIDNDTTSKDKVTLSDNDLKIDLSSNKINNLQEYYKKETLKYKSSDEKRKNIRIIR